MTGWEIVGLLLVILLGGSSATVITVIVVKDLRRRDRSQEAFGRLFDIELKDPDRFLRAASPKFDRELFERQMSQWTKPSRNVSSVSDTIKMSHLQQQNGSLKRR